MGGGGCGVGAGRGGGAGSGVRAGSGGRGGSGVGGGSGGGGGGGGAGGGGAGGRLAGGWATATTTLRSAFFCGTTIVEEVSGLLAAFTFMVTRLLAVIAVAVGVVDLARILAGRQR